MTFIGGVVAVPLAAQAQPPSHAPARLQAAPTAVVPPLLQRTDIDRAVSRLAPMVGSVMEQTGVPGLAVAIVYRNAIVYAQGFGRRDVARPDAVDADTVFLLASVSKPIAATVVAALVGRGLFDWSDPVRRFNPAFALSDPYVTDYATFADLLSHRSGLRTGAGDLLEDLGFDRETILSRLARHPLAPFRSTDHYSNIGYTAGGEAAARAAGLSWEDLAQAVLFSRSG